MYPDEEVRFRCAWVTYHDINYFVQFILSASRLHKSHQLKIAPLVSILQDEWGSIRDGVNSGLGGGGYASRGVALRDRGSNICSVMHRHRSTMTAVLYSAPFEQLIEQLQGLEKLVSVSGSNRGRDKVEVGPGTSVPTKNGQILTLYERSTPTPRIPFIAPARIARLPASAISPMTKSLDASARLRSPRNYCASDSRVGCTKKEKKGKNFFSGGRASRRSHICAP
jgi:hypothetical protein